MEPLGASTSLSVSRGHFALIREAPKQKKNNNKEKWHGLCWGSPWMQRASQIERTVGEIILLLICCRLGLHVQQNKPATCSSPVPQVQQTHNGTNKVTK